MFYFYILKPSSHNTDGGGGFAQNVYFLVTKKL